MSFLYHWTSFKKRQWCVVHTSRPVKHHTAAHIIFTRQQLVTTRNDLRPFRTHRWQINCWRQWVRLEGGHQDLHLHFIRGKRLCCPSSGTQPENNFRVLEFGVSIDFRHIFMHFQAFTTKTDSFCGCEPWNPTLVLHYPILKKYY